MLPPFFLRQNPGQRTGQGAAVQAPDADGNVRAAPPHPVGRTEVRVRQTRVADRAGGGMVPARLGVGAVGRRRCGRRRLVVVEVGVGAAAGRGGGRSGGGRWRHLAGLLADYAFYSRSRGDVTPNDPEIRTPIDSDL